ncbi:MSMEG_6728 family protein [Rhodococcus sp. NPDC019627]|uniref:MSMEG_6728 family protein n=1 Tax=unclassified Rhodococcus (in: high G+C Gram-positive bacteria) TaxID=192944 RepID=UPI0033DF67EF
MQTFVPDSGFVRSAKLLDDRRLGKQRVETFQILRALVWPSYGWKNHPATAMWRGFTPALVAYGVAMCGEWAARGHTEALAPQLLEYSGGRTDTFAHLRDHGLLPPWLGRADVHASHRRVLAEKAPDAYPPQWRGDGGYVWPTPVYPRWPLRTADPAEVLPPAQAETLVEGADNWDVLRLLHRGESVSTETATPSTIVAASLVRPGLTAVILDADPVPDDEEPTPAAIQEVAKAPTPSIARQPTAEDRDAMEAEAADPHRLRFFRRGQPIPEPDRYGLVITVSDTTPAELQRVPTLAVNGRGGPG